jgi:hypothetical protein
VETRRKRRVIRQRKHGKQDADVIAITKKSICAAPLPDLDY